MANTSSKIVAKWKIILTIKYHYSYEHHFVNPKKVSPFKTYTSQDNLPHLKYPKPKFTRKFTEISNCYRISHSKIHVKMR